MERAVKELELDDMVRWDLDIPAVHGDFRSLTLVFLNLFENAARAMGGAGQIRVVGVATDQSVTVKVADNGPGIPCQNHSHVFELSKDRSRPHNLGFGLWWVRTVMERMGGSIGLQSDGRSGTTFVLEFPLERATE